MDGNGVETVVEIKEFGGGEYREDDKGGVVGEGESEFERGGYEGELEESGGRMKEWTVVFARLGGREQGAVNCGSNGIILVIYVHVFHDTYAPVYSCPIAFAALT